MQAFQEARADPAENTRDNAYMPSMQILIQQCFALVSPPALQAICSHLSCHVQGTTTACMQRLCYSCKWQGADIQGVPESALHMLVSAEDSEQTELIPNSAGFLAAGQEMLEVCGRSHSLYEVYRSIEAVHAASPPTWSRDLISGLPHLTDDYWHDSLEKAIDAEAPHVSVYDLQVSRALYLVPGPEVAFDL